ncbi:MAG: hypothetical protein J7K83_02595 [Candidatus Aenigmarchaeota archaeon]|nr:hypothetical protein [Candidatus Aenigmarchaeota archaeon]
MVKFLLEEKYVNDITRFDNEIIIESKELSVKNGIPKISKYLVMGYTISYILQNYKTIDEMKKVFVNTINVPRSSIEDK